MFGAPARSKLLILFAICLLIFTQTGPTQAGFLEWTKLGIPDGTFINSIAVDPGTPTTLYAGGSDYSEHIHFLRLFKSTNSGASWDRSDAALPPDPDEKLLSFAIDPFFPETLYAGTERTQIYKSTDRGESWDPFNTGLTNHIVNSLAVDPILSSTVYAGTNSGIYKTTDGGEHWDQVNIWPPASIIVWSLAIHPTIPSILYAGTTAGVYTSGTGGNNWLPSGLVGQSVNTLVIDPWTPTTLYAGTASGVYKSTTSGVFWTPANSGFPELNGVFSLLMDRLNPSILYVGTGIGVYRSINGGESWSSFGLDGKKISTLALSSTKPRTLFAGGDEGLFSRQLETYIYLPVIQRSS